MMHATLKRWEWPGNEANVLLRFSICACKLSGRVYHQNLVAFYKTPQLFLEYCNDDL